MEFGFEILSIKYGWFEVLIRCGDISGTITNSDYLGNDAPQILLKNVAELFNETAKSRWLCWHDEPCAYILHIKKQNEDVVFEIYGSGKDSLELPYEGLTLSNEVTDKYFSVELPFEQFALKIIKPFDVYSSGENLKIYEKEWMPFPMKEYDTLKALLIRPMQEEE